MRTEGWIEGRSLPLIQDGEVYRTLQRRLRMTDDELAAVLREHGVESPEDVRWAHVQIHGRISVVKRTAPTPHP